MPVTDYDKPRRTVLDETDEVSLEQLTTARSRGRREPDPTGDAEDWTAILEQAGTDLSGLDDGELTAPVIPKQAGEFTCSSCFMVYPMRRLAHQRGRRHVCRDCA